MRITVESIRTTPAKTVVDFRSEYGSATALWGGTAPERAGAYEVELDLPGILCWEDCSPSEPGRFKVETLDDAIHICGLIEALDATDRRNVILRIGTSIAQLSSTSECPWIGKWVSLKFSEIQFFDTNI